MASTRKMIANHLHHHHASTNTGKKKRKKKRKKEEIAEIIGTKETTTSLLHNNTLSIDDNDESTAEESSENGWETVENPSSYSKIIIEKKQEITQKKETFFAKFAYKRNQVQQKDRTEGTMDNNNGDNYLQIKSIEDKGKETKQNVELQKEIQMKNNTKPTPCGVPLSKLENLISSSKPLLVQSKKQNRETNNHNNNENDKDIDGYLQIKSIEKETKQDTNPTLCVPSNKPGNSTASSSLVQPRNQNKDEHKNDNKDEGRNNKEDYGDKDKDNNEDTGCDVETMLAECIVTHSTEDADKIKKDSFYEFTLYVDGMTCSGCEQVVQAALINACCPRKKDGNKDIASVVVDWKSASAIFTSLSPRLNLHKIAEAVDAVGFEIYCVAQQKKTTANRGNNDSTATLKRNEAITTPINNNNVGSCKNNRELLSSLTPNSSTSQSTSTEIISPPPGFEFTTNRETSLSLLDEILKGGSSSTPLKRYKCHCGGEECICRSQPLSTDDPGREVSLSDLCVRLEANLTSGWWSSFFDEMPSSNNNSNINSSSSSNSKNRNVNQNSTSNNDDDDATNNSNDNRDKKNEQQFSPLLTLEDLLRSERPEVRDRLASIPIPCGCGTDGHDEKEAGKSDA